MAKRRGTRSYFPVHIEIDSLAGGVGRQAPSKRLPIESQNIDNFLISTEHSAEKRRGLTPLEGIYTGDSPSEGILRDLYPVQASSPEKDLWYHWYEASEDQRFLIVIDYSIDPAEPLDKLVYVYRIQDGLYFEVDSNIINYPDDSGQWSEEQLNHRRYITWGNGRIDNGPDDGSTRKAKDVLRAIAVGSSILILNTLVKAGFDTDRASPDSSWQRVDFNGNLFNEASIISKLQYKTSVTIDPLNIAESWNEWSQYIAGDKAYDRKDPKGGDIFDPSVGIWKVKDEVTGVVGPSDKGFGALNPLKSSEGMSISNANPPASIDTSDADLNSTSDHVTIEHFSGGGTSERSTSVIKFFYKKADVDAPDGLGYWKEATSSTPLEETITTYGGAREDWDGLAFILPGHKYLDTLGYNVVSTPTIFKLDRYANVLPGEVVLTESNTDERHFISIGAVDNIKFTFGQLAQAIATGINTFAQNEGISNDNDGLLSEYEWDEPISHCTAAVEGAQIHLTYAYPANQWERDVQVDDEGNPLYSGVTGDRYTDYALVSDYYYPDPDKQYLGQAIKKLSDLKFPPTFSSLTAKNNAEDAIKFYYPNSGDGDGFGKVYYLSEPYLGLSEGHFRVVDIEDQPYLELLRTPDALSVIDKLRMPKQLFFGPRETGGDAWQLRNIDWDMRTSGSIQTNPGPSIFHSDGEAIQTNITSMSFYRDRLFLSSDDKLISSRLGDWDNFWIFDPNNITVNDPIDLSVSSNSYTPITYLQPYRNFLFLGTSGDTQYELLGSENQISPLTAEVSPTSFFGMADNVEPVLMNNNLFFFDKQKLYIYFGEQSDTQQQALELSVNAPGYLPNNYASITVSSDKSSIYIVDADNLNHLYVYTNRVSGDQILQNSFCRFVLDSTVKIRSVKALDTDLYLILEHTVEKASGTLTLRYISLYKLPLDNQELDIPRLDYITIATIGTPTYNTPTDTTSFLVQGTTIDTLDTLILREGDESGREFSITRDDDTDPYIPYASMMHYKVSGNHTSSLKDTTPYVGKKFRAEVELSPQFYRNEETKAVHGTLNLRYGLIRYFNSGPFDMEIVRKKRAVRTVSFNPNILDDNNIYDSFRVPILGFSEDLDLKIVSENTYPLTITSLGFVGKFKLKTNLIGG